ncbi:hypothetical protein D9Q98_001928 [Chlorella vulgaris]|uniref:Uncharacterized protein n=1 Tax=Chlorella vulgaris TaxID=3077 RepID=A0A9D4Z067_CHLVU|nr:hypothetical protein D9Q98_001928 [Chlorella vulgaris]
MSTIASRLLARFSGTRNLAKSMPEYLESFVAENVQTPRTLLRMMAKAQRGQRKELHKREVARLRREAKLAANLQAAL